MVDSDYTPPVEYHQAIACLSANNSIYKEDATTTRSKAALSLLFEARLSRTMLRELTFDQYDEINKTLHFEGYSLIKLSKSSASFLSNWIRHIEPKAGMIFRNIQRGVVISNEALSSQSLYYILNKHGLIAQVNLIPPREKAPSELAEYASSNTLPEVGYTPINLRYLRILYRLSHKDVATMLGVSVRAAQSWEIVEEDKAAKREMSNIDWTRFIKALDEWRVPKSS